jgi:hypothetical protein
MGQGAADLRRHGQLRERALKFAVFGYETNNLGDDIQSLAAALHTSAVDRVVLRDAIGAVELDQPHALILNSWMSRGPDLRPPPATFAPIPFGFCLGNDDILEHGWLDYLRAHQPIGCRDQYTVGQLEERGISAFWTGCLTLFIGRRLEHPAEQRSGVLFVDVAKSAEERCISPDVRARAVRISTYPPPSIVTDQVERYAMASSLLARIASAELVVTRRLHIALPCISLGTPVVILAEARYGKARRRYQGFEEILPVTFVDDVERLSAEKFAELAAHRPTIPASLEAHYADLLQKLSSVERLSAASTPLDGPNSLDIRQRNISADARPHDLALLCGSLRHRPRIRAWSDQEIHVQAPHFLGAERFALELVSA